MNFHAFKHHFFLVLINVPLSQCTTVYFSLHFGCFQILMIMNKAVNRHSYAGFCVDHKFSAIFDKYQGVWLLDHMVRVCWILLETFTLSSVAVSFCIPTSNEWWSKSLSALDIITVSDFCHSDVDMISHYCINLPFSNEICWERFHMLMWDVSVFFGDVSLHIFCPLFNWAVCLLIVDF